MDTEKKEVDKNKPIEEMNVLEEYWELKELVDEIRGVGKQLCGQKWEKIICVPRVMLLIHECASESLGRSVIPPQSFWFHR